MEQTPPVQHSAPLVPHATHVFAALHVYGSPHWPPVSGAGAGQHSSPAPPHATHTSLELHVENGAVHPTPPAQQASPMPPHVVVLTHAPAVHVPCAAPQAAAAATHFFVDPSQHPPFRQTLSSQQASPVAPHAVHVGVADGLHASPDAVQKFACPPCVVGLPVQHARPLPPHLVAPVLQLLVVVLHVPGSEPPQVVPFEMHLPSTQQRPLAHVLSPQHGAFAALPHAVGVPFSQTTLFAVVSPSP